MVLSLFLFYTETYKLEWSEGLFLSGGQFTWGTRVIWTTSSRRRSENSDDVKMILMNVKLAVFILTVINTWLRTTNIIKLILMIVFALTTIVKVLCMMLSPEVYRCLAGWLCKKCHHSTLSYSWWYKHPRCVEVLLEQRQEPKVWEAVTSCRGASQRPSPCSARWVASFLSLGCFFLKLSFPIYWKEKTFFHLRDPLVDFLLLNRGRVGIKITPCRIVAMLIKDWNWYFTRWEGLALQAV